MFNRSRALRGLAPVVLVLAAACSDRNPVGAGPVIEPTPDAVALIKCDVSVSSATMSCAQQSSSGLTGPRGLLVGHQGVYVKVTSMGTSYDAGTERLHTNVTVQNLLRETLGLDTTGLTGVKVVFVSGPVVTSGVGSVEVANPDGMGTFTAANQPYFEYVESLETYEISQIKNWQFSAPAGITFSFTLMVSASLLDESARTGSIWTGATSTDWSDPTNWSPVGVPDDSASVSILADSAREGRFPVLSESVQIANLYVSVGSTVNLNAFTLTAIGNVDAPGTVSGGTIQMTGAATVLRGNIDALVLTGSTTLQGATKATGAVSLQDGVLKVSDFNALSISIP